MTDHIGETNEMVPITPAELAEAKELCEKATPGEWHWSEDDGDTVLETNATGAFFGKIHALAVLGSDGTDADMRLIARSRAILPRLIAEVERLRDLIINSLEDAIENEEQRYDILLNTRDALREERICDEECR